MGLRRILRSYFTLNDRERRGTMVLLFLLIALIGVQVFLRSSPEPLPGEIHPSLVFRIDSASSEGHDDCLEIDLIDWKAFDPNQITVTELRAFGLEEGLANRWVNYRSKGGSFKSAEDVLRLYGMDSSWVMEASRYMTFEDQEYPAKKESKEKVDQNGPIDLNTADTMQLKSIRGIGSFYARSIVQLRDRLGGFFSYDQLLDVYKIRDEAITTIAESTFIDTSAVQRIDLNGCKVEELGKHPYMTWKQAKVVVAYRQQHGAYQRKKDIMDTKVVPDSVYIKIAPYLSLK